MKKKKTPEIIKQELQHMNEEVKNVKELKNGISLVKKYEDLLKGVNRKIINIVGKQGELLKRDNEKFFGRVGLSRSNIFFKIGLYEFLCKFPVLKNLTLTSSYFKSNFRLIKKVCKANADVFSEKK